MLTNEQTETIQNWFDNIGDFKELIVFWEQLRLKIEREMDSKINIIIEGIEECAIDLYKEEE